MARAMAEAGRPYVLSPIISSRGTLLDGTPLAQVIDRIDEEVSPRPAYYTVSCVHPSVFRGRWRPTGGSGGWPATGCSGSRRTPPASRPASW